MRHSINQGSDSATLDFTLRENEEILAFADLIVAMSEGLDIRASWNATPANWWGTGESSAALATTQPATFRSDRDQVFLSLAPRFPAAIANMIIESGAAIYLRAANFLAARSGVAVSSRFPAKQFGNLRLAIPLLLISGEGEFFYSGCGKLVHREIKGDEVLIVAARCLVGFEDSIEADWEQPPQNRATLRPNPTSSIRLYGPGQVIYQTRSHS
jgi:uncharacterized protein (AIM24 family)